MSTKSATPKKSEFQTKKRPAEAPPAPKKQKLSESQHRDVEAASQPEFDIENDSLGFPLSLDPIDPEQGPYHRVSLSFLKEVSDEPPAIVAMGTWQDPKTKNVHVVLVSDLLRTNEDNSESTVIYDCGNRTNAQNYQANNPYKKAVGYRRKGQ